MRKLCLTLVAAVAALSSGSFTTHSDAMALGGLRAALDEGSVVDQVRLVCTHFYNGRWHHREMCVWVPNHGHHGHHGRGR
jgi:hypothetical protein